MSSISPDSRGGLQRFLGGTLSVFGGLFLLMIPLMAIWPAEGATTADAWSPLVFAVPLLAPGIPLWRAGRRKLAAARAYEAMVIFVRSVRRVEVSALADRLRVDLETARTALGLAIRRHDLDLVEAPGLAHYVHRKDLEAATSVGGEHCPSCHAPTPPQVILPGEVATCPYCATALVRPVAVAG
ncbi:MAG: hypothetical protein M3Y59_21765 [Myxococcota bacterium]|nr:hypothetical protein [Myxococcota bacterium]